MKIAKLGTDSVAHGVRGETRVTFESNSTAFYAQISGLAEDKIAYPIRELASNAWDAARGDVDITLPTLLNPVFSTRDRGPGLSHEFMTTRFCRMYDSDKRDDPTKIGGWGLGRFSAFAYLLSEEKTGFFLITSWHEGIRSDYVMDLSGDGQPTLKTMASAPSDEPSGLKVQFSVQRKDIDTFADRARSILWGFDPRPRVTPELNMVPFNPILEGSNWKIFHPDARLPITGPQVRIGCVVYPIDLKRDGLKNPFSHYVNFRLNILFDAPINSVQPTLSREDLAYDQRTLNALSEHIAGFVSEYRQALQSAVDQKDTMVDAAWLISAATRQVDSGKKDEMRRDITWKGKPVPHVLTSTKTVRYMHVEAGWRREKTKTFDGTTPVQLARTKGAAFVIEHSGAMSMEKIQAAGLTGKHVFWVRCRKVEREAVLDMLGNPESVINLDDYEVEQEKKPKNIRRRSMIALRPHEGHVPRYETREIDITQPHYFIRQRGGSSRTGFSDKRGTPIYDFSMIHQMVTAGHRAGALQPIIYVMTIPEDSEPPAGWIDVLDHLISACKPHINLEESRGWRGRNMHDLPEIVSWMKDYPDIPFQRIGGDLGDFFREMHAAAQEVGSGHRYYRSPRTMIEIMRFLGEEFPDETVTDQVVAEVKAKSEVLCRRYKLLKHLTWVPNYSYNRVETPTARIGHYLLEYERLLMACAARKRNAS